LIKQEQQEQFSVFPKENKKEEEEYKQTRNTLLCIFSNLFQVFVSLILRSLTKVFNQQRLGYEVHETYSNSIPPLYTSIPQDPLRI
jgi:hypothetical protein